jgi:hypothetical protein
VEGRATTTICAFNRWLGFGTAFYRSGEWFSVGLLQRPFSLSIFDAFVPQAHRFDIRRARCFFDKISFLYAHTARGFVAEPSFKYRRACHLFLAPYCADNFNLIEPCRWTLFLESKLDLLLKCCTNFVLMRRKLMYPLHQKLISVFDSITILNLVLLQGKPSA